MSSLFLDDADLERLTGRKRPAAQIDWLRDHGYRHEINGAGRAVVVRAEVEARLVSKVARGRSTEPNWSALKKAG